MLAGTSRTPAHLVDQDLRATAWPARQLCRATMHQALVLAQQQAPACCASERQVASRHLQHPPLTQWHTATRAPVRLQPRTRAHLVSVQPFCSSHAHQRQWLKVACAAVAAEQQQEPTDEEKNTHLEAKLSEGLARQSDEPATPFDLPLPDAHHQPRLEFKAVKALRTQSNTLAAQKQLINVQAGQNGITQTFLSACMDVLAKHEFVKVRLGDGSGLDRKDTAAALEKLLDCICVHQIGFTITLYRQKGLPRPSNCPPNVPVAAPDSEVPAEPQGQQKASSIVKGHGRTSSRRVVRRKPANKQHREFEVV